MKKRIHTDNAPAAIGPYSQAVEAGGFIYVSGQIPVDPATGELAGNTIEAQAKQSLSNVRAILESADCTMNDVVKTTVLLADIADFAGMNGVYADFFSEPFPARAAFAVKDLPKGAKVEIEVIALKS
ncbi:MAG: RidA family protein [Spirochaetales bacterium]|uniref:RidA family protein n=1 Tax=Candidatus Thalassospirochaeta sargassi TaxID=3119039 RepID=A0AAJ1IIC4_9SPIO|nr:RidA family protein [Spirochaetales bacterium]